MVDAMTDREAAPEGGRQPAMTSSAARRAYEQILEQLVSDEMPPGTWLRESALAGSLGMSRTPVREALSRLGSEGLVRLERHRGAQVVGWSREQIVEIYGLRAVVEGYVAAVAAQKINDTAIAALEANLTAYCEAIAQGRRGAADAAALNNEFHALILEATRSDSLISLLTGVFGLPLVRRTFLRYSDRDLQRSAEHHRELIEALRQHDSESAEMIMKVHIRAAQRAVLQNEQFPAVPPAT
ncbi:GntR family transcriptional regulator [Amycolatopsis rubida]|uniref:DNA-binding transcriptional regulator, GntR family n=1 Tax=Amycolatopsis rubida TaxID=112413 RepID=A0A1I5FXQ4_9PSEU|nr:GntR family transcriptional regulator [Amycolatopsis rubida]SFO28550.1 DNA-binding transcriptional regulator, GntR family [Amycolatopsis rubida]